MKKEVWDYLVLHLHAASVHVVSAFFNYRLPYHSGTLVEGHYLSLLLLGTICFSHATPPQPLILGANAPKTLYSYGQYYLTLPLFHFAVSEI